MLDEDLSTIEVNPINAAKRSIIWLHGLGADGRDFVPFIPELALPDHLGVRFVFPHAPVMPITINNGYAMRAWYDIASIMLDQHIDQKGISQSIRFVEKLIEQENERGIDTANIMLGGFSQGAVVALATGLIHSKPLGGVIALSGYLAPLDHMAKEAKAENHRIPIFIGHGTEDPIVPYALGKAAYVMLSQLDYPISWHSYPIAHTVSTKEIADLREWIEARWR